MARNRDERYERAMLLSQDLRALNLQPEPMLTQSVHNTSAPTNGSRKELGKVIIQPPKRPRMPIPPYLNLGQAPANEPVVHAPATPATPQKDTKVTSPTRKQEIDVEGSTGTFIPALQHDTSRQNPPSLKRKTSTPQPFWRKIFKSPH